MNPNLVAGMASSSTQAPREQSFGQTIARAILQQWSEVKAEDGSVERTFTAIQILRQACDYLHQGLMQVGSAVEQRWETDCYTQPVLGGAALLPFSAPAVCKN